jgi:hypothetical protein
MDEAIQQGTSHITFEESLARCRCAPDGWVDGDCPLHSERRVALVEKEPGNAAEASPGAGSAEAAVDGDPRAAAPPAEQSGSPDPAAAPCLPSLQRLLDSQEAEGYVVLYPKAMIDELNCLVRRWAAPGGSALEGLQAVAITFACLLEIYAKPNPENPEGMCDSIADFKAHFAALIQAVRLPAEEDADGEIVLGPSQVLALRELLDAAEEVDEPEVKQ